MNRLALLLLLFCSLGLHAQTETADGSPKAERALQWLLQQQADSLLAAMSDEMKAALTREQLAASVTQMEQLAGPYKEHGAWNGTKQGQMEVWQTDIVFGETPFSCVVAFGADGSIQGLRIIPAQQEAADDDPLPADAVEVTDTVRSADGPALPAALVMSGRSASPPIVVMVHGSGALDRDETVMANKTFRQLSRLLAERGISSLRYDKRTFVTQQPATSMDDETISDAIAAVSLARVYNKNVYLLGHSLGAMLAPIIAQRTPQLSGIIMLAAPARDMNEVVAEQVEYLSTPETTPEQKQQAIEQLRSQAPHYFKPQGQVKVARQLSIPMLLLQGGRDYQVTMRDFNLWQQALKGHKRAELHSYPTLNHLFIEGEGKSTPQEYLKKGRIPQQVADDIAHFINHSQNP